jgi:uncharacterized protein (DUF2252 family)
MPHPLTAAERRSLGQSKRRQLSRQANAEWRPVPRRPGVLATIAASMRGRIPNLVAVKYERMLASPLGFFRGAVAVMAADLALLPNSGVVNQICGDAHVRNLGAYAAPDGRLVFDINDFDETTRGPFEWDLKRLATSLVLAGRELGAKKTACEEAVLTLCSSYRKLIATLARLPVIDVARYQVHRLERITPVTAALHKAEQATPESTLEQLTHPVRSKTGVPQLARIFKEDKPLLARLTAAQAQAVQAAFHPYRETLLPERRHFLAQYRPIDFAFKVVGIGSIGLRDYLVYLEGNGPGDPLFLQFKEQVASAYAAYFPDPAAAHHQGQRVAEGQRAMQFQSDPFLGWTSIGHRHYLVRQLRDYKGSIDVSDLKNDGLRQYAEVCGELLARGHARSGDANLLLGYLGNSEKLGHAVSAFATAYADQTEADWKLLVETRKPAAAATKHPTARQGAGRQRASEKPAVK